MPVLGLINNHHRDFPFRAVLSRPRRTQWGGGRDKPLLRGGESSPNVESQPVRNATRNRILTLSALALYTTLLVAFAWIMVAADGGRRAWVTIAMLVAAWVYLLWTHLRDMRQIARVERALQADGIELPDERPIPIRIAESRESLFVSVIALTLIVLVFVAYFGSWLRIGRQ